MVYDHEKDEQVVLDLATGEMSRNGVPRLSGDARDLLTKRIRQAIGLDRTKLDKALATLHKIF